MSRLSRVADKSVHVAVAILPQGIMGLLVGVAAQVFPVIITKPRIFIPIGALCKFASPR